MNVTKACSFKQNSNPNAKAVWGMKPEAATPPHPSKKRPAGVSPAPARERETPVEALAQAWGIPRALTFEFRALVKFSQPSPTKSLSRVCKP